MTDITVQNLREYFSKLCKAKVEIKSIKALGADRGGSDLKGFGYGKQVVIELDVGGSPRSLVFGTLRGDTFGHDFPYDRARSILMAHLTFNNMPNHVRSVDAGAIAHDGTPLSIGDFSEFFQVSEMVEGAEYYRDLERLKVEKELRQLDLERCQALSDFLVSIHRKKLQKPEYYTRRIRELIGDGECIMGLIDNYPRDFPLLGRKQLEEIEKKCVQWRWRLKEREERLSQVHGDFHPWNILFREGTDFSVLDRSRGEWGEPSDDIAALTVNYIFYSLQVYGRLAGPFEKLYDAFVTNYLDKSGDHEVEEVIQPFYAWRSLVVASPVWYPTLKIDVRRRLFNFIRNILDVERMDFKRINSYLEAGDGPS